MNNANYCSHQHTAIDLGNATMVVLKLESKQLNQKTEVAWGTDEIVTPKGHVL